MADKRISQLVERTDIANNDVVPIVASGATTTNKATISSIQEFMQENLDLGVTSVGITLGTTGTDVSVSGSPITTSGNITINIPTASATNRGLLSSADWTTFNNKQPAGNYVTLDTAQTITAQKVFTTSGSSDTMIISHGSGSGFALDVIKAGNGEAIRVTKTSGSGNAMSITGGNFSAQAATFSGVVTTTPDAVINGVNVGKGGGSLTTNTRLGSACLSSNTTGTVNTSVGYGSLQFNTIGSSNTSVGVNSLQTNTEGDANTSVGSNSLTANTTGDNNTSVGAVALYSNTSGTQNTATGAVALYFNTVGNSNTAVGLQSAYKNTTGNNNVAVGLNSLFGNTTGTSNVALGHGSGHYITDDITENSISNNSVFVGSQTKAQANNQTNQIVIGHLTTGNGSNTVTIGNSSITNNYFTGNIRGASLITTSDSLINGVNVGLGGGNLSSNTRVGTNALYLNTTGSGNTGIGFASLSNNTTGSGNVALGLGSMQLNTTGGSNTAIGYVTLQNNTTGNANTATGAFALENNTTGSNNTAIGQEALENNIVGAFNTAIGFQALQDNTNSSNTAIGYLASSQNSSGSANFSGGARALENNTTGSVNTSIGFASLQTNTTGGGNVAIGEDAGRFTSVTSVGNTNGGDSVFIGRQTKPLGDSQTNQIVIGHNAIGNGSNTVTLGNDSITNTYLKGAVTLTGALNGTSASFTGDVTVGNGTSSPNLAINRGAASNSNALRFQTAGTNNWFLGSGATSSNTNFELYNHNTATSNLTLNYSTGAATFSSSVQTGGNVLIPAGSRLAFVGDTDRFMTPEDNIQGARIKTPGGFVVESAGATFSSSVTANELFIANSSILANYVGVEHRYLGTTYGYSKASANDGELRHYIGPSSGWGGRMTFYTDNTEKMRITSGGNVGIGTDIPTRRLHVLQAAGTFTEVARFENTSNRLSDDFAFISILGSNAANTNSYHYIALTGGADRMYIYGNGNVVNTNNSYGALSDIKIKENVVNASNKLDDLMKVKVRNFNYIGDDKKQIGVIAQELEEVFPAMIDESEDFEELEVPQLDEEGNEVLNEEGEVVTTKERVSKGTTTKSVKYSVFVPMLIKAIQELKTEIDSLKNQIK